MFAAVFVKGDELELRGHVEYFFGETDGEAIKNLLSYYKNEFALCAGPTHELVNPVSWHDNHYHVFAGEVGPESPKSKLMRIEFYTDNNIIKWRYERSLL